MQWLTTRRLGYAVQVASDAGSAFRTVNAGRSAHPGDVERLGREMLAHWLSDAAMRGEAPALYDDHGNALLRVVIRDADDDTVLAVVRPVRQPA